MSVSVWNAMPSSGGCPISELLADALRFLCCLRGLSDFWLLTGAVQFLASYGAVQSLCSQTCFPKFPFWKCLYLFEMQCPVWGAVRFSELLAGALGFLGCLRGLSDFWLQTCAVRSSAAYGCCPESLLANVFLNFPFGIVCIIASHRIVASKFVVSRCHCGVRVCDSSWVYNASSLHHIDIAIP